MNTIKFTFVILFTLFTQVRSDSIGAISDGFVLRAISKPLVDYTQDIITDKYFEYYICTKRELMIPKEIIANKSICYPDQEVVSYILFVPGSLFVKIIFIISKVIFIITTISWCFTSSIQEKVDVITYICLNIIGQIIYEILCGNDDDDD